MTAPQAPGGLADRVDRWPERLAAVAESGGGRVRNVVVLAETDSTQDAARRAGAIAGDVCVAARQTAGRGRHGRVWADTGDEGVAVTFVVARATPQRLAIASAVGVARAIESHANGIAGGVGIKWPNDVVVDGRKVAGILVEQTAHCALVGIGVNVTQTAWPSPLAGRAVSLRQVGVEVPRIAVLEALLTEVPRALALADAALLDAFAARDVLTGAHGRFRCGERLVEGRVVRVDPVAGITVATDTTEVFLDAATCIREA